MGQVSRFNPRPPIKPLPIESLEELDQREAGG
jgi:hypothetical protein